MLGIEHGLLRNRIGKRDGNRAHRSQVFFKGIGVFRIAGVLAKPAADAFVEVHVSGLLEQPDAVHPVDGLDCFHLGVGENLDIHVMRRRGHLRGGDATGAIQRRKDLAEGNHVAPDAGLALDDQNLQALIGQIERRLQASDSATDD
jgi:hypothetical protein